MKNKTKNGKYYIVVEEWHYPRGDGHEPVEMSFDKLDDAMGYAGSLAMSEEYNFHNETLCVPTRPLKRSGEDGDCGCVALLCQNDIYGWFYAARVIEVNAFSPY